MVNVQPVVEVICALLAIMAVGFGMRRADWVSGASASSMNRIVADVTFPALCLRGIIKTDRDVLAHGGVLVVAGFAILALAAVVGFALSPLCERGSRPTFVFCTAVGNWIFLPLPLATKLYGQAGTSTVLLVNVGAQVFLWTLGIWVLQGGRLRVATLATIVKNPGLWATALGGVLAFAGASTGSSVWALPVRALATALDMVAAVTVPLVSMAIGAQLADVVRFEAPPAGPLLGVIAGRLVIAPLATIALLRTSAAMGLVARGAELGTLALIAAMPVSLSCSALVERARADSALATRAILWTTLASVATVPVVYALAV